jgi:Ca2+-binding EF-hand superfamily protein
MKTAYVALATMVLATAVSAANAQPLEGHGLLARLDTDRDGSITKQEGEAARQHLFARLDRNGDGAVDKDEIDRARQAIIDRAMMMEKRLSTRWQRMDKDGDGKVSAAELESRGVMFELADRNGDGVVSKDEIDFMRGLFGRLGG